MREKIISIISRLNKNVGSINKSAKKLNSDNISMFKKEQCQKAICATAVENRRKQILGLDCYQLGKRAYNFPTVPGIGVQNTGITSDKSGCVKGKEKKH